MTKIEALAQQMNVTTQDVAGFVLALSHQMSKGLTFEQAIEANLACMTKIAERACELQVALRPQAIEWFCG